jgi:hypothetical protein
VIARHTLAVQQIDNSFSSPFPRMKASSSEHAKKAIELDPEFAAMDHLSVLYRRTSGAEVIAIPRFLA